MRYYVAVRSAESRSRLSSRILSPLGLAALTSALVLSFQTSTAGAPWPDGDADLVVDAFDNCLVEPNPGQADRDGDRFGDRCDCDFDQNGNCDITDFGLFLTDFLAQVDGGAGTDMDSSGAVGIEDFTLFLRGFQRGVPGPSAGDGPEIVIDSPSHGVFTTDPSVQVAGHVTGAPLALVEVAVNGTPATVEPDGSFSASADTADYFNPILAELIWDGSTMRRDRVTVIAGESIAEGTPAASSPAHLAVRLSDDGLDRLAVQLTDQIDFELTTLLPIYTYLTSSSGYDVYVDGAQGGVPDSTLLGVGIEFDAEDGYVEARIDMYEPVLRIWMDGDLENCEGYLASARIGIAGRFGLSPDPLDPSRVLVEQVGDLFIDSPGVTLTITDATFPGLYLCDLFSSADQTDNVVEALADILGQQDSEGKTFLEIELEKALNDLALASAVGNALGIGLEAEMAEVAEDTEGVTVEARTSIAATAGSGPGPCVPPAGAPDLDASYHVSEAVPSYSSTTPRAGQRYDAAIGVSTSALNQLLMAQVECGLLTTDLTEIDLGAGPTPITAQVLGLFIPAFAAYSPPSAPFRVEVRPTLAPILTTEPGPGGELAEMQIGHLELHVVDAVGGDSVLSAAVDARFGVDVGFDEAGLAFQLSQPEPGDLSVTVLADRLGIDVAAFETLMPYLVAPLLPSLASSLGTLALPSFLDMTLVAVEASRQDGILSLFVDLEPAPSPPLYWRRWGNRLEAYTSVEGLAVRGNGVPEITYPAGAPYEAMMHDGSYYYRRVGQFLRRWPTVAELAANAPSNGSVYDPVGAPSDAMMYDGTYYWFRRGNELRGYVGILEFAFDVVSIIHPANGSAADSMTYDGTYYWRRYGSQLRAYLTPEALAAAGAPVLAHVAYGDGSDSMMYDGTHYWRSYGNTLEAYLSPEAVAQRVSIYASLPAVGPPTDSMTSDGTYYWRRHGDYLEAYLTPRELALRQHRVAAHFDRGEPTDAMLYTPGFPGLYWTRYLNEIRYFYSASALANGLSPESTGPATGAASDSMMYDGTHAWRRYGNELRGYTGPYRAADLRDEVIILPALGPASDAIMYAP